MKYETIDSEDFIRGYFVFGHKPFTALGANFKPNIFHRFFIKLLLGARWLTLKEVIELNELNLPKRKVNIYEFPGSYQGSKRR